MICLKLANIFDLHFEN